MSAYNICYVGTDYGKMPLIMGKAVSSDYERLSKNGLTSLPVWYTFRDLHGSLDIYDILASARMS